MLLTVWDTCRLLLRRQFMQSVTSRQNPIVKTLRMLAAHPEPDGVRLLLDGVHLVHAAINAGLSFEMAAIAASRVLDDSEEGAVARALESRGVTVVSIADRVFSAVSPVRTPTGIVAIATRTATTVETACAASEPFVLVVLGVQDSGNLGALLRAGEAGGITGALIGGGGASPFSWRALRGSMGATLRLPVASGLDSATLLDGLARRGLRTVAAVPRHGLPPGEIDWTGGIALVMGNEGSGLESQIVSTSSLRVTIPMARGAESLNVATAGAVLVYAAREQRA
jgi:TrmH family RNA methyltransferase